MSSSRGYSIARRPLCERVRGRGCELACLENFFSPVRALNEGLAALPNVDRSHFARSSKAVPCASVDADIANAARTDLRWPISGAYAVFQPSMTFGRIARSSDDSTSALDVRVRERVPMLSVASPIDFASAEVQCAALSRLEMIGKDSRCLHRASWSSEVWARWTVRRQESVPLTPVDGDNPMGRAIKNLELCRRMKSSERCD